MSIKEYLVFQMQAPLGAFGDTAVGEFRPSMGYPSRTALLGLLAGALGLKRDQETEHARLQRDLGSGLMVINAGQLLRDFHTTQVPKAIALKNQPARSRREELQHIDLNTILSTRDYRMNGFYLAALWSRSEETELANIQTALRKPTFTPYLGRKSCPPALPFDPVIVQSNSVVQPMKEYYTARKNLWPYTILLNARDQKQTCLFCLEGEAYKEYPEAQIVWQKDRLIHRGKWQFGDQSHIIFQEEV